MDMGLQDAVVVISGAAKGMGEAVTRAFTAEGAHLGLLGRDGAALSARRTELIDAGSQAATARCDITDPDQCQSAIKQVADAFDGRIDVLVNVAGGTGPVGHSAAETEPNAFADIVELNLQGCFHTMQAALPYMMAQRSGRIVNVGGTFGMRGRAGRSSYAASKWGLRGLTKSVAIEAGPYNVNVNLVAPGMVDGPRFRERVCPDMARRLGISEADAAQRHADEYALGRISQPSDVGDACVFLASKRARQVTGVDFPVDGGWAAL